MAGPPRQSAAASFVPANFFVRGAAERHHERVRLQGCRNRDWNRTLPDRCGSARGHRLRAHATIGSPMTIAALRRCSDGQFVLRSHHCPHRWRLRAALARLLPRRDQPVFERRLRLRGPRAAPAHRHLRSTASVKATGRRSLTRPSQTAFEQPMHRTSVVLRTASKRPDERHSAAIRLSVRSLLHRGLWFTGDAWCACAAVSPHQASVDAAPYLTAERRVEHFPARPIVKSQARKVASQGAPGGVRHLPSTARTELFAA